MRWRMVTHGAIDGYSRVVLYLKCTSNNRATTVYELFLVAVQNFNLPSRVRSDQGLENVLVARHRSNQGEVSDTAADWLKYTQSKDRAALVRHA